MASESELQFIALANDVLTAIALYLIAVGLFIVGYWFYHAPEDHPLGGKVNGAIIMGGSVVVFIVAILKTLLVFGINVV